jgi:hypothetical protein
MGLGRSIARLLLTGAFFYLISIPACREGFSHDQSGFCVIDFSMPPPALGFEYWTETGFFIALIGTGLMVAAYLLWRHN